MSCFDTKKKRNRRRRNNWRARKYNIKLLNIKGLTIEWIDNSHWLTKHSGKKAALKSGNRDLSKFKFGHCDCCERNPKRFHNPIERHQNKIYLKQVNPIKHMFVLETQPRNRNNDWFSNRYRNERKKYASLMSDHSLECICDECHELQNPLYLYIDWAEPKEEENVDSGCDWCGKLTCFGECYTMSEFDYIPEYQEDYYRNLAKEMAEKDKLSDALWVAHEHEQQSEPEMDWEEAEALNEMEMESYCNCCKRPQSLCLWADFPLTS